MGSFVLPIGATLTIGYVVEKDFSTEPLEERGKVPLDECPNLLQSSLSGNKCGTGDTFVSKGDPRLISHDTDVVDIELFGIAQICYKLDIAWRSGKYIFDFIGVDFLVAWQSQINLCSPNLIYCFDKNCLS